MSSHDDSEEPDLHLFNIYEPSYKSVGTTPHTSLRVGDNWNHWPSYIVQSLTASNQGTGTP